MRYTSAHHQGAIKMPCLKFWVDLMTSIFLKAIRWNFDVADTKKTTHTILFFIMKQATFY